MPAMLVGTSAGFVNRNKIEEQRLRKRRRQRKTAIDYLFGSPVRTQTLATLEALGGRAWQKNVHRGVPGQFAYAVKNVVNYFISEGVLEKRDQNILFRKQAWTPALRRLLRAYLKAQPAFGDALRESLKRNAVAGRGYRPLGLVGPPPMQRALITLAINGPLQPSALLGSAGAVSVEGSLDLLEREGIIAIRSKPRTRIISLNAAYPVYREFRALLLSLGNAGLVPPKPDLADERGNFSPERLFTQGTRSEVLIMVGACRKGEIEISSLSRLLPQYDRGSIRKALLKFRSQGILRSRTWKGLHLYSLDPAYPQWRALKRLLDAIAVQWPYYRTMGDIEEKLFSERRKARSAVRISR